MLKVAIIGCGKQTGTMEGFAIGHAHAQAFSHCGAAVELYGVDISPENLRAFGERFELPPARLFTSTAELYAAVTPDIVTIGTWPSLHAPMLQEAIEQGVRGVLCEKPIGLDPDQVQAMLAASDAAGVRVAVAHQRCHNARFQIVRDLLADGAIGEGLVLEARVGGGWDILSWSVHWFDFVNKLFGGTAEWLLAGMDHSGQRRYGQAVEDASVILAQYSENRQAIFITGPENPQDAPIVIRGSAGLIRFREGGPVQVLTDSGLREVSPEPADDRSAWQGLAASLVAAVETGAEMPCDLRHCAAATTMAYAAQESARSMRRVPTPCPVRFAPLEVAQRPPRGLAYGKRVTLYADAHFGSGGRDGIAAALTAITGQTPRVIDAASADLSEQDLAATDLLCLYHTQREVGDETRRALTDWIQDGRPTLALHAALGAWPEWTEWTRWLGRVWDWGHSRHPHEPSTLSAGAHSDWPWQEAWLPQDEVFIELRDSGPVRDLLRATISDGDYPAAWLSESAPNLAIWVPGHRGDMWSLPVMRSSINTLATRLLRQEQAATPEPLSV